MWTLQDNRGIIIKQSLIKKSIVIKDVFVVGTHLLHLC